MATFQRIHSTPASQETLFKPEKVDFSVVSIFKSRIFKILGTAAVLTAAVVWILPEATSLMDVTLDPMLIKSLLGTLLVGAALIGLKLKKELLYEISLLSTIYNAKPWWTVIDDNIVLGALPLEHQIKEIKALGVTHVISLVELFESEPGIVQPAQPQQWNENDIQYISFPTQDFYGVPKEIIAKAIDYIRAELKKNPKAKFYIHCKAGVGRSTTVVLCYKMVSDRVKFSTKEITLAKLQKLRPQVKLQAYQMLTAQAFLDMAH